MGTFLWKSTSFSSSDDELGLRLIVASSEAVGVASIHKLRERIVRDCRATVIGFGQ